MVEIAPAAPAAAPAPPPVKMSEAVLVFGGAAAAVAADLAYRCGGTLVDVHGHSNNWVAVADQAAYEHAPREASPLMDGSGSWGTSAHGGSESDAEEGKAPKEVSAQDAELEARTRRRKGGECGVNVNAL